MVEMKFLFKQKKIIRYISDASFLIVTSVVIYICVCSLH